MDKRDALIQAFKDLSNKHGFRGHSAEMLCEEQAELALASEKSIIERVRKHLEFAIDVQRVPLHINGVKAAIDVLDKIERGE